MIDYKRYFESSFRSHEELAPRILDFVALILQVQLYSTRFLCELSDHGTLVVLGCARIHIDFTALDRDTVLLVVRNIATVQVHMVTQLVEGSRGLVALLLYT